MDIIHSFIISTTLDVTEGIFAVLYVLIMGLTRFYKPTVFFTFVKNSQLKAPSTLADAAAGGKFKIQNRAFYAN